MSHRRTCCFIFGMLLLVTLLSVDGTAVAAQKYDLKWGTAAPGGLWPLIGNAMLEDIIKANPGLTGATVPIGGAGNLFGLAQNKLNIAFSFSDALGDAWEGMEDFKGQKIRNVMVLANVFPEPSQFVVYAESGITSVPQLKGKAITPGPKGGATTIVTRRVFDAYGMSIKDVQWIPLSFADGAEQMLDRHIDAICYGAMVYPAPSVVNVASQRPIRLLSFTDEVIAKMLKTYKGLDRYTLPPASYKGVDYPVKGIAANTILVVSKDMPDDVAYAIVKTIAQNFENYGVLAKAMALGKAKDMGKDIGFPYHPGALKFYKEKGWVK